MSIRAIEPLPGGGRALVLQTRKAAVRIVRAVDTHTAAGELSRSLPLEEFVARGKAALRLLMGEHVPAAGDRADALLVAGEALSNAQKYGAGQIVNYRYGVSPGRIVQLYRYETAVFDANPPEVDIFELGGRGIQLMRSYAHTIHFDFSRRGWLKLILVCRWDVGGDQAASPPA